MAKIDFYYNNVKVNEDIKNWRDLEIEIDFEDEAFGKVKTGDLQFTGSLATKINDWNTQGLFGGPGLFEAPPFRIEVCGAGNVIFNGGINTGACETLYQCDEVSAPLREGHRTEFLDDRANSFSFAYLASLPNNASHPGAISQNDYVLVPYVINSIPDGVAVITSIVSLFVLVKELEQAIEKTASIVVELIGDIVPTVGSGATIAVGAIIADILKLILYLAYIAILVIAIIDLSQLMFESLIQPVKYKKGMRVSTLFQRACHHLGVMFSSTILQGPYKDLVHIPKKTALNTNTTSSFSFVSSLTGLLFKIKRYDDATHPNTTGYYEGTFGDLIAEYSKYFNAEAKIIKNQNNLLSTLHFERADFFQNQAQYTLPNLVKYDPHGTNACDLNANYFISYALDAMETNTYDLYEGTNIQHILSPNVVLNSGNVLLRGLEEKRFNLTRTKMKMSNNAVEDIFNVCYAIANVSYQVFSVFCNITIGTAIMPLLIPINAILSVIGIPTVTIPSLPAFPPNPVGNRIGMMLLSSDFIGVPKVVIVDSSNLVSSSNELMTSADYLMDNYHFINFAICLIDSTGAPKNEHNQWVIYKDKEIPLCCSDYVKIRNNNFVYTHDGKIAKIDTLVWNPYLEKAKITFRVKQLFTKNLKEQYLINKN